MNIYTFLVLSFTNTYFTNAYYYGYSELDSYSGTKKYEKDPGQWALPIYYNYKTKPFQTSCTNEDWDTIYKCPLHHPYIWTELRSTNTRSSIESKYGKLLCINQIICSNIEDLDAPGIQYNLANNI